MKKSKKHIKRNDYISPIPYNAYPFGGLINQGVTGLAGALGADPKLAHLLGSGVATATGAIPGMQDNLFQAGSLVNSAAQYSNNDNLKQAGQLAQTGAQVAGMFPFGGTQSKEIYNNWSKNSYINLAAPIAYPTGGVLPDNLAFNANQSLPTNKQMLGYGYQPSSDSTQWINPNDPNSNYFAIKQGMNIPNLNQANQTPQAPKAQLPKHYGDSMGNVMNVYPQGYTGPTLLNSQTHANGGFHYPMGGVSSMNANSQIEKQEVVRYPNGSTDQADAPTHANGGLNTNLPGGTQIFSDRLKSSNNITFAKEAEKFKNNKWDKILDDKDNHDPLRTKTATMMKDKNQKNLDMIFQEQESQKQNKAHKAFNKFMMKHGGQIPMFYPGGTFGENQPNMMAAQQGNYNYPYTQSDIDQQTMAGNKGMQYAIMNQGQNPNIQFMNNGDHSNQLLQSHSNNQLNPQQNQFQANQFSGPSASNNFNPQWQKPAFEAANFLGQNVGNLAYLHDQGKRYDKVDYGKVNPKFLDPTTALSEADRSSYGTQRALPGISGGNAGAAMNSLLENSINRDQNKRGIQSKYDQENAGIYNQFGQFNKELDIQGQRDQAANKGQSLTNYYKALGATGQNIGMQSRDIRSENMDQYNMGLMSDYLKNYTLDPKTGKFTYRQG